LIGAGLALIPSGFVWIQEQSLLSTLVAFVIVTVITYSIVRFIHKVISWVAGIAILAMLAILGWEAFIWLRDGNWPGFCVIDAASLDLFEPHLPPHVL
jgi:hypothetical protein